MIKWVDRMKIRYSTIEISSDKFQATLTHIPSYTHHLSVGHTCQNDSTNSWVNAIGIHNFSGFLGVDWHLPRPAAGSEGFGSCGGRESFTDDAWLQVVPPSEKLLEFVGSSLW